MTKTWSFLRTLGRWGLLAGLAGPVLLWQTSCIVDPDLILQAGLQFVGETAIFALDNLLVGPREASARTLKGILMRRLLFFAMRILPATGMMFAWGCGVTDRQLVDFATSTSIRVFVQTLLSAVESAIVSGTGNG